MKLISLVNMYRLIQKKVCHAHSNAHKPPKPVAPTITILLPYDNHILKSGVGGAFQSRFAACISPFPFGSIS